MPLPQIFEREELTPFSDTSPIQPDNTIIIPYATDRMPAGPGDREKYYKNQRTHMLRLGLGRVRLGKGEMTWDELRTISLLKNRTEDFPLQVSEIQELGVLSSSVTELHTTEAWALKSPISGRRFADIVNYGLDRTSVKEVYIYVHGFKVNFENPLLVASELWHYMGYQGVFIPYAWPSTTSIWAYAKDAETTSISARNFRVFLEFLARHTRAEKIHIIGYSAGTRLVVNTLKDMALIHRDKDINSIRESLKLGNVILIGSDVNTYIFVNALFEGILGLGQTISIYQSSRDQALGVAKWLFAGSRLGQAYVPDSSDAGVVDQLRSIDNLHIIDVSSAESAMTRNGHYYFRDSPWVSSDILTTLVYGIRPGQRGLVREEDQFAWSFPEDYIRTLKTVLAEANSTLKSW